MAERQTPLKIDGTPYIRLLYAGVWVEYWERLGMSELYSPIIIWFLPSIISIDDEPLTDPRYFIEITAPPSNRRGVFQHLRDVLVKPIIPNQPLLLKLIRSDCFRPIGRYEVRYFLKHRSDPIHKEQWIVREPRPVVKETVISNGVRDVLPPAYYDQDSVSWPGTFKLHYYQDRVELEWLTNPPAAGVVYQVQAKPALTLDQLIDHGAV